MKHILLPEENGKTKYYRANLHCHSNMSDGAKTPEELKKFYKENGYSILCITDHGMFIPHSELSDDDFLLLNGFEFDINAEKCCHLCCVALDESIDTAVCYHRSEYLFGNGEKYRHLIKFDESKPDYVRQYTPECINDVIKQAHDAGFFVTYNHPTWSLERYPQYIQYEGMDAMEIVNYGCVVAGYDDDNGHAYNDILDSDKKIFCTATDDNHNHKADYSPDCDSFGGYVMIASDNFNYKSVADALKNGMFYSSSGTSTQSGPQITSLTYEDNKVKIKCSPAKQICLHCSTRSNRVANAADGEYVSEAEFPINTNEKWFRITVRDENGYKAYTNAYFLEDLK